MLTKKINFQALNKKIIICQKCPRLVEYISNISSKKVRRFRNMDYWGKPIPSFGDHKARLLIVGLAPAAHGGNRTGRMFTGDSSGQWLFRALYETGFANKPDSLEKDDGLKLSYAYITAIVRCAPPQNKPLKEEIRNCSEYLLEESMLLKRVEIVLTLGRIAYDTIVRAFYRNNKLIFKHGKFNEIDNMPTLVTSYHPSKQNTQTGRLSWSMWINTFKKIQELLQLK
ncbi:uracil-DNA glycosylase [[Eubacterium] cellulosolvens]